MLVSNVLASARTRSFSMLRNPHFWMALLFLSLLALAVHPAHAADASGGGGASLPWEGPIEKLRKSVSGPVAFGIALMGIIGTGAGLIWGGEISEFLKRMIYVILVVCIIVFANSLLTGAMFSGAMVPSGVVIKATDLQTAEPQGFIAITRSF